MKKILFHPVADGLHEPTAPVPAKETLARWYKDMPHFHGGKPDIKNGLANVTVKACMPFYDAMTAGYVQQSWQDISFDFMTDNNGDETIIYNAASQPASFSIREGDPSIKLSKDFYPFEFVFHPPYYPEVPKGWSVLLTQPLNSFNSPIQFTSGIMDSDQFTHSESGNLPFYVRRGFSGIIPKGTPLYQMIPIKRESWRSEVTEFDLDTQNKIMNPIRTKFWGGYRHNYWTKKTFK